jgi:hypothetical protein
MYLGTGEGGNLLNLEQAVEQISSYRSMAGTADQAPSNQETQPGRASSPSADWHNGRTVEESIRDTKCKVSMDG